MQTEFAEIFEIENDSPARRFGESIRFSRFAFFQNFK